MGVGILVCSSEGPKNRRHVFYAPQNLPTLGPTSAPPHTSEFHPGPASGVFLEKSEAADE